MENFQISLHVLVDQQLLKSEWLNILQEAWKEVPSSLLDSLTRSMPRRVAAVIKVEGWYTQY